MDDLNVLLNNISAYKPDFQKDKVLKAFEFAKKVHADQYRKTGEPYFSHLYKSALYLTELQADEDTVCAALLHDTLENTSVTSAVIKREFGDVVAKLVRGVTKVSKVKYRDRMAERQIVSLRRMFISMAEDLRVIIIRLADRLHNMQTLRGVRPDKQLRIAKETLEIYCPLANLLGIWHLRWQLEDLCFKYLYPTEYQTIDRFFGKYRKESKAYMDKLKDIINRELKKNNLEASIEGRVKHYYSIFQKIRKQKRGLDSVYDLYALRIIVDEKKECYEVLGILHSIWKPIMGRFKDYVAFPKTNGYQSLHTTVFGPGGRSVEIQIRTKKMHEEAEYGVAAHWFYKQELTTGDKQKADWIVRLLKLQKSKKDNQDFVENLKVDVFQDRIFIFTPQGEVKDLPRGSSVLDFAYSIHRDVGNHFKEAVVNGVRLPADRILQTGDTVEVRTSLDITPDLSWLKNAKTAKTKEKIRTYLLEETREKKAHVGRKLLRKILEREGRDSLERFLQHKNFSNALKKYSLDTPQDLFSSICEEKVDPKEFINTVYKKEGLSSYIFKTKSPRMEKKSPTELVTVEVIGRDRIGILGDIAGAIAQQGVNIASFKLYTHPGTAKFNYMVRLEVPSFQILENVFEMLEGVEGIESVKRLLYPYRNFLYKFAIPFLVVFAHFIALFFLKVNLPFFYLSFIFPAAAFYFINTFIDHETSYYLRRPESYAISVGVTGVGMLISFWEVSLFAVPLNIFEILYLVLLHSSFILFKSVFYLYKYISQKGRLGFLLASKGDEKRFIKQGILFTDSLSKRYKKISRAYEKYLFTTYHDNYMMYNCWRDHFAKIHDQIHILMSENEDLSDKVIALIGSGPEPGDRDFCPQFTNLLIEDKLKRVVLIDFSKLTLVSAINNLLEKGVPLQKIRAYQIDVTRGLSAYFTDKLLKANPNDYGRVLRELKKDLRDVQEKQVLKKNPQLLREEDRFDFFVSSMFAAATLFPVLYEFKEKVRQDNKLSPERKKKVLSSCNEFENNYNTYVLSLTTKEIMRLGKREQRGLVIVDTEKIYRGTKKIIKTVADPVDDFCIKSKSIKDYQLYRWLWQDESDHYHVIHSLMMDVDKGKILDKST